MVKKDKTVCVQDCSHTQQDTSVIPRDFSFTPSVSKSCAREADGLKSGVCRQEMCLEIVPLTQVLLLLFPLRLYGQVHSFCVDSCCACSPTAHNLAIISLFLSAGCEDILAGLGHCSLRGLSTCCLNFSSDWDIGGGSSVGLGIGPSQVLTFLELLRLSKSRTWLSLCPRTTVSILTIYLNRAPLATGTIQLELALQIKVLCHPSLR